MNPGKKRKVDIAVESIPNVSKIDEVELKIVASPTNWLNVKPSNVMTVSAA